MKTPIIKNVYIHLPFCHKKCNYCAFPIQAIGQNEQNIQHFNDHIQSKYIQNLTKEINFTLQNYIKTNQISSKIPLQTLYFGGGTPSLISLPNLQSLFKTLSQYFTIPPQNQLYKTPQQKKEISIEVDPGTFNSETLQFYSELGINRLSMGIQTFNEDQLKLMNRSHTLKDITNSLEIIKNDSFFHSFQNISLDLIINGPKYSQNQLKSDLDNIIDLSPGHLSIYNMMIEEDSTFFKKHKFREEISPVPGRQEQIQNYQLVRQILQKNDIYDQYEVSSYSKTDLSMSKHNQVYWEGDHNFFGFGMGASSLIDKLRVKRPQNLKKYYQFVENLKENGQEYFENVGEIEENETRLGCILMGQLRRKQGLDLNKVKEIFGLKVSQKILDFCSNIHEFNQDLFSFLPENFDIHEEKHNFIQMNMNSGVLMADELSENILNFLEYSDIEIKEIPYEKKETQ